MEIFSSVLDSVIEEGLLLGGAAQKYKWAPSPCPVPMVSIGAMPQRSPGRDRTEGWRPASWLSSGIPPKPDVPTLLPLAETES